MKRIICKNIKESMELSKTLIETAESGGLPPLLHHYTCFDVLQNYILKSKSLQLTRLDKVNDLNEGNVSNIDRINNIQRHNTFISCFQDSDDENIPMWCIYARDKNLKFEEGIRKGIRLTLDTHLLRTAVENKVYHDVHENKIPIEMTQELLDAAIPFIMMSRMLKVRYDDDAVSTDDFIYFSHGEKLNEKETLEHFNSGGQLHGILNGKLTGTYKKRVWDYEKEVRIIVTLINNCFSHNGKLSQENFHEKIYISLSDLVLKNCIITINPFVTEEEYTNISRTLLESFDWLTAEQIKPSCITNELRMT